MKIPRQDSSFVETAELGFMRQYLPSLENKDTAFFFSPPSSFTSTVLPSVGASDCVNREDCFSVVVTLEPVPADQTEERPTPRERNHSLILSSAKFTYI